MGMENSEILAQYDRDERREMILPGMRREVDGPIVRQVMEVEEEGWSYVSYSDLQEHNADEVIERQVAYFRGIDRTFEWTTYEYDTPSDLESRLIAQAFEKEETGSLMVLELDKAPARLLAPVTADVRRVEDVADLEVVRSLLSAVWEEDFAWFIPRMSRYLAPEGYVSIYVAYVDDAPASAGWTFLTEGSRFAGLFGGTTLAQYRGRGLYTALLAARAQEAIGRGYQFLVIDAGEMSRPIVERQGFRVLTTTTPYVMKKP